MTIFREKVVIPRVLWLTIAIVVAACLANTVVMQKGGNVMRVYDLWVSVFRPSSYAGAGLAEVVVGLGEIAFYTLAVFGISALAGWLIAAIVGSIAVRSKSDHEIEPCRQQPLRLRLCTMSETREPIEIGNGQTLLIIVQGDRVIEYTWAMMPHVEFVKRTVGKLPDGAWVGTVSKIAGELGVMSSKTFYGYQLPAPEWVAKTVRAAFR